MNKPPTTSICIPTYNGNLWIRETITSILNQDYQDFEILIGDDCSTDNTIETIKKLRNEKIKIFSNKKNLGYGKNLQALTKLARGEILFLMGQDDILLPGALKKTINALSDKQVGAVTRPYYWFDDNIEKPVRIITPFDKTANRKISILDGKKTVQKIFETLGQLSGLAYRKKYIDADFHEEIFPAHIYPFASITKKYKIVFLKDYTVAVRIASSQTRFKSSIYDISPTLSWVKMFNTVYRENKYKDVRQAGIEQITTHFVGLVQLKNYSTFKNFTREILILVKLRPFNLLSPKFWFYTIGTIVTPKSILIPLVDNYKRKILARKLKTYAI